MSYTSKAGAVAACVLFAAASWAQQGGHNYVPTKDLKWADVPSLPKGAQIAVIEGSMSQPAAFTVRLKFPANYQIPPHTHPAVERVTVLSGTFNMGMGDKFDRAGASPVGPGDFMVMQPGTTHFGWTTGETVLQLHGTGPWGITYVNPEDDPRKK